MTVAKRIIPCLDVDKGRVVKGVNFVDIVDAGDPVEAAKRYNDMGADELCLLDITASHEQRDTLYELVEQIAAHLFIPLTVGGGVRSVDDVKRLLRCGADKVAINSAAVSNPQLIADASARFGVQCIVAAIDAKQVADNEWHVFTQGGRNDTGIDAVMWAVKLAQLGAGELLITSMDRDGTKNGFDNRLLATIAGQVSVPIIASGGVGELDHFTAGVVEGNADALLAASVFHFNEMTVTQVKQHLQRDRIDVRL